MSIQQTITTPEQFDHFVQQPQNADRLFELIGGVIYEVPSNPYVSKIAGIILTFLNLYLFEHPRGHVTGEAGGYMVGTERYAPDVAYISYERQPQLATSGYNPNPPELAVEVVSNESDTENRTLTIKPGNYLAAGTVVWIVRPAGRYVEVHRAGQPPQTVRSGGVLAGGDLLPGFSLPVDEIFRD